MPEKLELGKNNGIFRKMGNSNLSKSYVTAEDTPLAALAKSKLTDLNEVNNLVRLLSWAMRHNVEQCIDDITVSLVGRTTIGGYNLSLAAQVETGIISPEAMGVPLSRHAVEALKKERELRQQQNRQTGPNGSRPNE
jgi:hypothetical protein